MNAEVVELKLQNYLMQTLFILSFENNLLLIMLFYISCVYAFKIIFT